MIQILTLFGFSSLSFLGLRQKPVLPITLVSLAVASLAFLPGYSALFVCITFISLLIGAPIFILIGAMVVALFMLVADGYTDLNSMTFLIRQVQEISNKEVLLAVPFFVLAGEIMTEGTLATRLINVSKVAFGFLPGGLAVSAVMGCVFFAAISGSSPVTVIAIGSIMVPALKKAGFGETFSMGLVTSAGSLGILIPPSIPMILYALMVSTTSPIDPSDLFLAGVLPGLLMGSLLAAYSVYVGLKSGQKWGRFSITALLVEMKSGFWSLLLPVIILGGIYSGAFTPTEGACVAVVYALLIEGLVYRSLDMPKILKIMEKSMVMIGTLFLIMAMALGLNHYLVLEQIPDQLVLFIKEMDLSPMGFLLVLNLFLLGVGAFMDIISAILILAPILAPIGLAMGIDPIHLGIIFIVNLEIGYLTPPVGLNLFVASTLFKKPIGQIIRGTAPCLAIMLVGLFLVTWFEPLSTFLVKGLKSEESQNGPKVKSLQELMDELNVGD